RAPSLRSLTQRFNVVENVEAAPVRTGNEIGAHADAVVLYLYVAHRHSRHIEPERLPVIAVVERYPHLGFRRRIQQSLLVRILANRIRSSARRDAVVDLGPRLATIMRAPGMRIEVVDTHSIRRRISGLCIEVPRIDVEDARPWLDLRRRDVGPLRTTVRRNLNVAVVSACPYHVHIPRRGG